MIREEIQKESGTARFNVKSISQHIHNGIDAPITYQPTFTYVGFVPSDGNVNGTLESILPKGWTIDHPFEIPITFTGSLTTGATSATLTTAWTNAEALKHVLFISFSNGDISAGTFTLGSTSVTWADPLSSNATANATVTAVGQYVINHNLGTNLYAVVVTAMQSLNVVVSAIVSPFLNSFEVDWYVSEDALTLQETSFTFHLTQINNKKASLPTYITNGIPNK